MRGLTDPLTSCKLTILKDDTLNEDEMQQTIAMSEALAAAFAAWRFNGRYVKKDGIEYDYVDDVLVRKTWSNRELAVIALGRSRNKETPTLTITEEDRANAAGASKALKHFTMKILAEKLNEFETKCYHLLGREDIDFRMDLGLVCYLPALIAREQSKKSTNDFIKGYKDAPQLTVGERIQGVIKIHSRRYVPKKEFWVFIGDFKGSLVTFFRDSDMEGDSFWCQARVKDVKPTWEVKSVNAALINYIRT